MRTPTNLLACFFIAVLAFAVGCGTPGAPLPPSLQLPRPVDDFAAQRKGNRIVFSWTQPTETTDHQNVRHAGATRICRSEGTLPAVRCVEVVAELSSQQIAQLTTNSRRPRVVFEQAIKTESAPPFSTFSIESLNDRGRAAGLSNQIVVPTVSTLAAPKDVRAEIVAEGVVVSWTGIPQADAPHAPGARYTYELFRRAQGSTNFNPVGEIPLNGPSLHLLDKSSEWEKTYDYRVATMTHLSSDGKDVDIEGDDSAPVRVTVHDVFPPATPTGLQAVFSGVGQQPFIDLSWAPNTESDLAGYNIYRHQTGAAPVKINSEPVKAPAFRDSQVQPGQKYWYAVSAFDLRNNESGRSEETSESVPEK